MYKLPELGFEFAALEPNIDAKTMEIHHDKHHQTYVDNLNKAVEMLKSLKPELHDKLSQMNEFESVEFLVSHLEEAPENIRVTIRNNAGGHLNHSFFWEILNPKDKKSEFSDEFMKKIEADQGSLTELKDTFKSMALANFGSGWTWLVFDKEDNKFEIINSPNQDSPLGAGLIPVFGIDIWEHAYYLKYQNRRAEYLDAFWEVLNFKKAEEIFNERVK